MRRLFVLAALVLPLAAACGGDSLVKAGVDAACLGVNECCEGVGVGGAEFCNASVFKDQRGEAVLVEHGFQGFLVGGLAVDSGAFVSGF